MNRLNKRLWHYTIGAKLSAIWYSGEIRPATAGVPAGERPIVWFSFNQEWEITANKSLLTPDGKIVSLTKEETENRGGGLVRIEVSVEAAPYDWKALREMSGMSRVMSSALYKSAIDRGSCPGEWRGSFEAVSNKDWLSIEVRRAGRWIDLSEATKYDND